MKWFVALLCVCNVVLCWIVVKLGDAVKEWMDAMKDLHYSHQHVRPRGPDYVELSGPVLSPATSQQTPAEDR